MNTKEIKTITGKLITIDTSRYTRYLDQGNFEHIRDLVTGEPCQRSKRNKVWIYLITDTNNNKHFVFSYTLGPSPVGAKFRANKGFGGKRPIIKP